MRVNAVLGHPLIMVPFMVPAAWVNQKDHREQQGDKTGICWAPTVSQASYIEKAFARTDVSIRYLWSHEVGAGQLVGEASQKWHLGWAVKLVIQARWWWVGWKKVLGKKECSAYRRGSKRQVGLRKLLVLYHRWDLRKRERSISTQLVRHARARQEALNAMQEWTASWVP